MPIYKVATFSVRREALESSRQVIDGFASYVQRYEPGTRLYLSLQNQEDPTRFVHVMAFDDEAAEQVHRSSEATRKFTEQLYPSTVDGVAFQDCQPVGSGVPPKGAAAARLLGGKQPAGRTKARGKAGSKAKAKRSGKAKATGGKRSKR
jgi:quinol monooxygenase YgiN